MKLKRSLAVLLSAVLMLSFLPLFASAGDTPGALYVGEKDKSMHNLIRKYEEENRVKVYSANNDESYYTVHYENGVGYVLTFYNNYKNSEPVDRGGNYCGVYCDGDLTIRVSEGVTLDMNREFDGEKYDGAYGIYVKGDLTIEGIGVMPKMTVCGDKEQNDSGATGIYAESLCLHNISVNAAGGNIGVRAAEAIAMLDANLYANNTADMKNDKGEPLFNYGIAADNFIQIGGSIIIGGTVDVDAYDFRGGTHRFDEDVVVYLRDYAFKQNPKTGDKSYYGLWHESFDLYVNASLIPSCIRLVTSGKSSVVSVNGNKATLNNKGTVQLSLVLVCGQGSYVMDTYTVGCSVAWWQWIPYILSGAWLSK